MSEEAPIARRPLAHKVRSFAAKMMRLTAYFLVLSALSVLVAGRIAYGRAKEIALKTGEDLVRLTEASQIGEGYRLRLNGEQVMISNASTNATPTQVLDRFQDECLHHADGMADEFLHLRDAVKSTATPKPAGFPGIGLLRKSDDEGGVVVCFAQGKETGSAEVYKRIAEFARTGDLASIGSVRYVVAKKGQAGTHVVALWTEGRFDLKKMFPEKGDAPGSDPKDAMRPEASRRVLEAFAEGAPYGIRVYESTTTPEKILGGYDAAMPSLGWQGYPDVIKATPKSRAFTRNDVDMLVTAERDGDRTMVSIVEMSSR
jgi:hypothetical protein